MQATKFTWLKPLLWGAVLGGIVTMILGFNWLGWTTSGTAARMAAAQADAAVTATLVPICLAQERADASKGKKLGELKAMSSSYEQTEFVAKAGWATFPGKEEPNRGVAEACVAALLKTAEAK